jgi:hypothetical protein
MQLSHRLVEGSKPGPASSCELDQVCVCHLAVADDPLRGDIGVGLIVWPEFVARADSCTAEDLSGRSRGLAFAYEQAHQTALGDRAGSEVGACAGEPNLGSLMMYVVANEQSDQHIRIEENGH